MITEIEKIDNKIFGYTSLIFTLFLYIAYVALINLKVFHDGFFGIITIISIMLLIASTITLFNKEQSSKDKDSNDLNNKSDIEPNINISSDKGEFLSEEEIKKLQGE